jgi:hypothetical protein
VGILYSFEMHSSPAPGKGLTRLWYQVDSRRVRPWKTSLEPSGKGRLAPPVNPPAGRLVVRLAIREEREAIYRLRHDVFARELGQYAPRPDGRLTDGLDAFNHYLVVFDGKEIVGFISITPPGHQQYSIDKYLRRDQLPFLVDNQLYEVRILTIPQKSRQWILALTLMYASFRWVESHGGTRIMAMGRHEVLSMYHRVGLRNAGPTLQAGAVTYHLLQATMPDIHEALHDIREMLYRIEVEVEWQLGFPFRTPAGGFPDRAAVSALGRKVETLGRREKNIHSNTLDA